MADKSTLEPVAIVGMACIFPGAPDLARYWQNIQGGVDAISEVPAARWDPLFYDPDSSAVDRFYCRRGGFVDDYVSFDPLRYGVMPRAAESADPDQLLSLRVGVEALQDAGYGERDFPRQRTGVIIGRGNYLSAGTLRLEQHVRMVQQTLQTLRDLMPGLGEEQLDAVRQQLKSKLDYYGPDVAVGMVPNLVASRLANRLDLHGPAYTVDAACASSLLAVEQACDALRNGQCDMMLAGGLHFTHDLTFWATFCQLGALSRREQIKPFAEDADGILAGEGIGMLVLKRLSDAEADGDRIYAVIQGVGSASDGRSSSLLAPAVEGQLLALQRAWQQTSLQPADLGLLEAHGTGTPAGDQAELETVRQFFNAGQQGAVIGSVKSMIGHAMPAAGVAGLIKAALSVYHGVLPPTLHCERPHALLGQTRFRAIGAAEPWAAQQRVAAVNAFGFGGINAHVVLSAHGNPKPAAQTASLPQVVTLAADSLEHLIERLDQAQWDPRPGTGRWRLAILEPTAERIALARKVVAKGAAWHGRNQIYFSGDGLLTQGGKLAFVFPGVDSSFEPRADDVAAHFGLPLPAHCETLSPANELLKVVLGLTGLNRLMFEALQRLRIQPQAMAGHSIGEWSAMAACGMVDQARVDEVMGSLGPDALQVPDVYFLAAACEVAVAEEAMAGLEHIAISHDNCPHQVVLCGRSAAVDIAHQRLRERQVMAQRLPFSSGFHSPMFASHMAPYRDFFCSTPLNDPSVPLWSATTARPFPADSAARQQLSLDHLVQPVRFRALVQNLYEEGVRVFVQVGTGSLPGFIDDTLKGRPHLTVSANTAKRAGMEQLCHLSAALWVEGAVFDLSLLGGEVEEPARNGLKLRLGVPLVRLDQPMPGLLAAPAAASPLEEVASDDPLQQAFQQTLAEIRQAGDDIRQLWQQRRQVAPVVASGPRPFDRRLKRRLDVNDTVPLVKDHAFYPQRPGWPVIADRHPVIPLTMELSLLRDAVEQQLEGYVVVRLEEIHAYNWLVVSEPVEVEIRLNMQQYPVIEASIEGYIKARAVVAREYPTPPPPRDTRFENPRAAAIDAEALYADNWMFHGPAYQGVVQLGPIADNGIIGRLRTPEGQGALLDNMGQLAGYWVMEQERDCLAMPIGVDCVSFFGPDPEVGQAFDCCIWLRELDGQSCVTDQQLLDARGRVVIEMQGWQTRRYHMDRDFWLQTKQVQQYLVSDELGGDVVLFRDRFDTAILRDYMARRFLNQPEMREYEQLSPRRRRQWLNGRLAVKDAVRAYLWHKHGHAPLYPKEIAIHNGENGEPLVAPHISNAFGEGLHVSIAHKDLLAVGIAREQPVGVDVEKIDPRSEQFISMAFSEAEQALLPAGNQDEWLTRCWVAKEAVAKRLGTGLGGKLKQFTLEAIDEQRLKVNGCWVQTMKYDNYIIGWTL